MEPFYDLSTGTFEPASLIAKLNRFRDLIKECELRQAILGKSVVINLKELKRWVDDAQDVFDLYSQPAWRRTTNYFVRDLAAREKSVDEIYDNIRGDLLADAGGGGTFGCEIDMNAWRLKDLWAGRRTIMGGFETSVYGRHEVEKKIEEVVFSNVGKVVIIPIVGPGGVGKTTLSHRIYSRPLVPEKFDTKGWANCGSHVSDLTSIMKNILEAFTKKPFDSTVSDTIKRKVQEEILGRRFLLVLDNASREILSLLCDVCALLSGAHLGKVVVTTRDEDVASFVKEKVELEPPFVLGCLENKDSWLIFEDCMRTVFPKTVCSKEIGKQFTFKCNGLPLSIKTLASALRFENNENKNWERLLTSNIWESDKNLNDGILPALRISYLLMPVSLQRCFVCLSLFPKGHVFYKNDVIVLWVSLGLLKTDGLGKESRNGEWYLHALLQMSMIEPVRGDEQDWGLTMHDLIHDLATTYAWDDFLIVQAKNLHLAPINVRYLSILVSNVTNSVDLVSLQEHRELRVSQIVHQRNKWKTDSTPLIKIKLSDQLLQNLEHLKALVLSATQIEALPDSIGNLKLLRYLDLKSTGIERLPDRICDLQYLQTLDVTNCPLRELPERITNLVNLKYLVFERKFSLCMPRGISQLGKLRVLPRFDIKKGEWHCIIDELNGLRFLSGELCVAGLGNIASVQEVRGKLLQRKHCLEVLRLDWSTGPEPCSHLRKGNEAESSAQDARVRDSSVHVLEMLKPSFHLQALHIYGYPGFKYPTWLGDPSFEKLVSISLVGTGEGKSCELLPSLGQLPYLKALFIKSMWDVRSVGKEFYYRTGSTYNAFHSLQILKFDDMLNWTEWHVARSFAFGPLRTLKIIDCPKLENLPDTHYFSLTKLVISGCDKLSGLPELPLVSLSLKGELNIDIFRCSLHLRGLRTLKVCFSGNIRSLPLDSWNIPFLQVLIIHRCRKLQTIVGLGKLESLQVMKIQACENLQFSLNEQLPPQLRHLTISNCPMLQKWKMLQKRKFQDQIQDDLEALAQLSDTDSDADADELLPKRKFQDQKKQDDLEALILLGEIDSDADSASPMPKPMSPRSTVQMFEQI